MIAARGASFSVGRRTLVRADVTLQPGEVLGVLGANGAGKSTLLRLLAGELMPSTGAVTLDGVPLGRFPANALARRRAILTQRPALVPGLSVVEAVALGRIPHGEAPARSRAVVDRILESEGLVPWADRRVDSLSGGEAQRVHWARCLAQVDGEGRFLFLDEPTAALDLRGQVHLLERVREVSRILGALVILHDLNLAAQFCDRLLVLKRGLVLAEGAPGDVLTEELVDEAFGVRVHVVAAPGRAHPWIVPLESVVTAPR